MVEHNGDSKVAPNVPSAMWSQSVQFSLGLHVAVSHRTLYCALELPNNKTALNQIIVQQKEASSLMSGFLPFGEDYCRKDSCIG